MKMFLPLCPLVYLLPGRWIMQSSYSQGQTCMEAGTNVERTTWQTHSPDAQIMPPLLLLLQLPLPLPSSLPQPVNLPRLLLLKLNLLASPQWMWEG